LRLTAIFTMWVVVDIMTYFICADLTAGGRQNIDVNSRSGKTQQDWLIRAW
jgi:hypothetical protein